MRNVTAKELIEALEACSHNAGIPMDKLEVAVVHEGWDYSIKNYSVIDNKNISNDLFVVLHI